MGIKIQVVLPSSESTIAVILAATSVSLPAWLDEDLRENRIGDFTIEFSDHDAKTVTSVARLSGLAVDSLHDRRNGKLLGYIIRDINGNSPLPF